MAARRQNGPIDRGTRAPEFRLELLGGGHRTLAQLLADGPVLLAFFKVSCPVCQMTFPFLERIYQSGALRIVGVSQDHAADTRDFNREFGVTFPTLLDSEDDGFPASHDYGISTVPTMFLIEPDAAVARTIEGWWKKEIESLAAPALATLFRPGEYVPEWKAG